MNNTMQKRQHLPLMAKLNFNIDIEKLKKEFYDLGYDDWSMYDGLKKENASENGRIVRRVLLEYFLNDEELKARENEEVTEGGEAYKMLCLTDYNNKNQMDEKSIKEYLKNSDARKLSLKLEKICDPKHPMYIPEADEKNYDVRNVFCKGYVNEVMDLVEKNVGHVTRSRYAVLMPGEEIKPHMDINTDKAIRIHIPLITNDKCVFGVKGKQTTIEKHMPADGSVWFINQGFTHYVKNNGDEPRVHLVFSVVGQNSINEATESWRDEALQLKATA